MTKVGTEAVRARTNYQAKRRDLMVVINSRDTFNSNSMMPDHLMQTMEDKTLNSFFESLKQSELK